MARECAFGVLVCVVCPAVLGCADVKQLVFSNRCGKDIYLNGWNEVIAAGQTLSITSTRPRSQRIEWRYTDGEHFDFLELNSDWNGPGHHFCGHPSYSNYNGFSMPSKFEALNPDTGGYACNYPGAAIACEPTDGPCSAGGGYLCQGSPDCSSEYGSWMRNTCAQAINPDGSWSSAFKDTQYGTTYPDFWCTATRDLVATLIDCVDRHLPIVLAITTCDLNGPSPPAPSPQPSPPPPPSPSPSGSWVPCTSTSAACCEPSRVPGQFCPGQIPCRDCGSFACECPLSDVGLLNRTVVLV